MKIGGRQVDAATVHVGLGVGEAVRLRANDAAEYHSFVQIGRTDAVADLPFLESCQHHDLAAPERGLAAVGEAHTVRMFVIGRRLHNDADRAARVRGKAGGAGNVHQRHDLGADGEDQVGMVMHTVGHNRRPIAISRCAMLSRDDLGDFIRPRPRESMSPREVNMLSRRFRQRKVSKSGRESMAHRLEICGGRNGASHMQEASLSLPYLMPNITASPNQLSTSFGPSESSGRSHTNP